MVDQSKNVLDTFDDDGVRLNNMTTTTDSHFGRPEPVWLNDNLGIQKELLTFKFISMQRPSIRSKCRVILSNYAVNGGSDAGANSSSRNSSYLDRSVDCEQWIQLNTARSPLDFIIELVLQQMLAGEKSRCSVRTKCGEIIQFDIELCEVIFVGYLHQLNLVEMYDWAAATKANGVAMYKEYPKFAQRYFNDAAKALISFKPFDDADEEHGVTMAKVQTLFDSVCMNVAACLLKEGRYDETLAVLVEQTDRSDPMDKACYRRAVAHLNLKQYEEARQQLERFDWKHNREAAALHENVMQQWSAYKDTYSNMVKKMFG